MSTFALNMSREIYQPKRGIIPYGFLKSIRRLKAPARPACKTCLMNAPDRGINPLAFHLYSWAVSKYGLIRVTPLGIYYRANDCINMADHKAKKIKS